MPPVAPPRTSSNHYNTSSGTSGSKRRDYTDERSTASSRRGDHETSRSADINGSNTAHAESAASRSRRSHHHAAMAQSSSRGTSSPRDGQGPGDMAGLPIRSRDASHPTTPSQRQPSREASEVLNKLVVSYPENDVQREKAPPPPIIALAERDDNRRGGRHHAARRDKVVKFSDYYLGNTIGEGEFRKVKLGWKQDSGIQVAIKLIKQDTVGSNPSRLAKIHREITILRGIQHSNIIRLHEIVETGRHIRIILEYASGGELFDYILTHRYLKDNAARRLSA
ncbi:kinase-like protein [Sodiomyces alkalinus F11]|uniref:Kinase-like protein n=1 Tax=Sodiomyces alkalinus (strain CBS 110278 / VKM F-3762 / F11) TaxID=1314773 RepID=A0A3N2Q774_SODAK|nr:kinase-like protein [Sodiomyces alkalinus F11]ROT42465.1 kinase-like protein [Sodiomyces alkalinus F11]